MLTYRLAQRAALALLVLAAVGCSDSTTPLPDGTKPPADGGTDSDGAPPAKCSRADFPFSYDGLCYNEPKSDGKRTQCGDIVENCDDSGKNEPALACWSAPPALPQGPTSVTLTGYVDVFSSGPNADGVTIEVYDYDALQKAIVEDAAAGKLKAKYFPSVAPIATDTVALDWTDTSKPPSDATRGPARACPADKKLRLPCIVPDNTCGTSQPYCDLAADQYCHAGTCQDRLRWEVRYRIENVPTNKRLVIRTRGKNEFDDGTWGIMLMYSVFLRADAATCKDGEYNDCMNKDGNYELEVSALSRSDYRTIPITAGLSGGIPDGQGAVAGEVRDCDDIVLGGFQVATEPAPTVMVYFNGNPVKTLPVLGRFDQGTNEDGIFAALGIKPGEVTVGAVGVGSGNKISAGTIKAAVLPDSVTVVAFDGPDPQ
ncbi:MAG: hypothetical protein KC503_26295 [Myxococcales bacterium]|nr:hypothetical protein [Myxococcales bacterium]